MNLDDVSGAWDSMATYAEGTCDTPAALAERFELPEDEVDERLLERNIELCPNCDWWVDSSELADWETCEACRS